METVKLKNGSEEAKSLVNVTMLSLQSLIKDQPIAFYELVEKARNKDHRLFGKTGEVLEDLSLIQSNHALHGSIKNIVLSAAKGEGLELSLQSPIN